MTLVLSGALIAAVIGLGVVIAINAFLIPKANLSTELRRAQRSTEDDDYLTVVAERFGGLTSSMPLADLEILGWSREYWYRRRITFAAVGFVLGCLIAFGLRLFVNFPLFLAVPLLGLLVAGIGTATADSDRTTKADVARDEMRLALSYFLEVAAIMLAGGAGAETALESAAVRGKGVGFQRFAREVARAKEDPRLNAFTALRNLGQRVGVRELVEFGDVMILSSENSATVRQALQDKASLLVFREQERRKVAALSKNVAMSIPVAGMAGGFIIWLVFPAIMGLSNF